MEVERYQLVAELQAKSRKLEEAKAEADRLPRRRGTPPRRTKPSGRGTSPSRRSSRSRPSSRRRGSRSGVRLRTPVTSPRHSPVSSSPPRRPARRRRA